MRQTKALQLLQAALGITAAVMLTSCASLFSQGNPNCKCTHAGPCVCCTAASGVEVPATSVVAQQQQQESTVDKSKLAELLNHDYTIVHYEAEDYTRKPMTWKDDPIEETAADLTPAVSTVNGRILPKSAAFANNRNDIFFYFAKDADGKVGPLRLCMQYYADDPITFNKLVFNIDGFDYPFTPANVKRGKGTGVMIWENSDDALTAANKDLAYALAHSQKWVQLTIHGAGGMKHAKLLSDKQKENFYKVLQLYRLNGGTF